MLTEKQNRILSLVRSFYHTYGRYPSIRELAKQLKVAIRAVQQHLNALKKKGYLSDQMAQTSTYRLSENLQGIPILGRIPAGSPTPNYEGESRLDLTAGYFGYGQALFALKVSGDSMIEDHICDGDLVIIRQQSTYRPRDIIAVRIDENEFSLKRIRKKGEKLELIPSNPAYAILTVEAERVTILGKFIGLLRKDVA